MNLKGAKKLVFSKKPVLARIYQQYAHKTWLEYAKENFPTTENLSEFSDDESSHRANELTGVLKKVLTPLLSQEKIDQAVHALKTTRFVSTSDHHGLLCHPFFVNNALLRSHPNVIKHQYSHDTHKPAIISLTCGGVSLGNTSYPRGIFFHECAVEQIRAPFISLRDRHRPVYGYPAISADVLIKEIERVNTMNLSKKAKMRYKIFLKTLVETEELWEKRLYSDQLTMMSDMLWEIVFGDERGTLVYLEIETLVRQLFLDIHLLEKTVFYKFLFDKKHRDTYLKHFFGVVGAHGEKNYGSHFFWYVDDEKKMRVQLWVENDELQTEDGKIRIPLTPNSIRDNLENYKILPSMALCYSMLSFYYGIRLGGGFSQVQYLTDMKKAYGNTLKDCNDIHAAAHESIRTDIFTGEYVVVGLGNGEITVPATLIDVLLYGDDSEINEIINRQFQTMSIGDSLDLMMIEFVQIVAGSRQEIVDLQDPQQTLKIDSNEESKSIKRYGLETARLYEYDTD